MSAQELNADDVVAKLETPHPVDADDVPEPIMRVARHIVKNTGLTGDYNDGVVRLIEGGDTIQWYPRSRMFSSHDDLLTWLQQPENRDVVFGQVGSRPHPEKTDEDGLAETGGYIEIHEAYRWGVGEE